MQKELQKKTETWMGLERGTEEQRNEAETYYETELMPLIEEVFIENNRDQVFEKVTSLIVSVGTSFEPIVLNLKLLEPEHILFLYTEKSESTLDKVVSFCALKPNRYEKRMVSEVEPMDIYREIKRFYQHWNRPERLYIDFSGGTKAMSSACALAGAMIDVQMIYVSSTDYLNNFRKPRPGSEELIYIENPIAVFGDMEMDKALELFDECNFSGAAEKLAGIKDKVPDPEIRQQMEFLYLLSKAYEGWDALDFKEASVHMSLLSSYLKRDRKMHGNFILMDFEREIATQAGILQKLEEIQGLEQRHILETDGIIHPLMMTMNANALTRESQEKYDMATLLMYRLLEMIGQRRLIHYNLFVSDPNYSDIDYPLERFPELKSMAQGAQLQWLKDKNYNLKQQLFRNTDAFLPNKIALMDGFILLAALEDPLMQGTERAVINNLKRMSAKVQLRNHSIFAHGLGPVSVSDYTKFKDYVTNLFRSFCEVEAVDYEDWMKQVSYINPMKSKNYLSGWGS